MLNMIYGNAHVVCRKLQLMLKNMVTGSMSWSITDQTKEINQVESLGIIFDGYFSKVSKVGDLPSDRVQNTVFSIITINITEFSIIYHKYYRIFDYF